MSLRLKIAFLGLIAVSAGGIWYLASNGDGEPEGDGGPGGDGGPFLGSVACRDCHEVFYEKWATSWHGLAMQPYTPEFVRANLTPQEAPIDIRGKVCQAKIGEDRGVVEVQEADGKTKTFPIAHVMGGKHLFYFLTPYRGGRLQVLPVAYDTRRKEWYDSTGSMVRHFRENPDQPIDWTDRLLTFNTSCFGCHVSQISKNYSFETDSYETTWTEPGINCESCHGPGEDHVRASLAADGEVPDPLEIIVTRDFSRQQMNSMCASCHAKLSPISTGFVPGERFCDHFNLVTMEDRDLYPDGRELGENYTYVLWLMSPCVAAGQIDCVHCHTSSGRNRHVGADADNACMPCHSKEVEDPAAHAFHPADSEASRCVSCHMPMTEFARMRRHDHSMLPPVPAATTEFGSPNACNICHQDENAEWADEWVRKWYPRDYQEPFLERGRLVAHARKQDWKELDAMLAYVKREDRNVVFASGLLRLLGACDRPGKWPTFFEAAKDRSPLVRASAIQGLASCPDPAAEDRLIEATGDEYRVVRVFAAEALARRPLGWLAPELREQVTDAVREFEAFLRSRPDDPASHYNLGNFLQDRGALDEAAKSYEKALKLDSAFVPALVNLSMVHARRGDPIRAERALRDALRAQPKSSEVNFNMGLLLAEQGRFREAERHLRRALDADPTSAPAAYNLGVLVARRSPEEALPICRKAAELRPEEPRYAYTYAFYQWQAGKTQGATATLKALLARHPAEDDATALLGTIYERTDRPADALKIYRSAVNLERLPPNIRAEFAERIRALEKP
jgi:tetratricopeptide (TPR) repeat protein